MAERSGVLEFTLGLETGGFLHGLGEAGGKLKGFIASMVGLGAIIEGVKGALEKGAELDKLSRRTGQTVFDLYELQRGFEHVGLAAEDVPQALVTMQRSLGGVNELGERTEDIFERMGLRINQLKHAGGLESFKEIIGAISRLDQNSAMKGASGIFGRNEGANMVQLSRSAREFAEGIKDAAGAARLFDRDSAAFADFERHLEGLKYKFLELQIHGAELVIAFVEAWKAGEIGEMIATTIVSGFNGALDVIPTIIGGISDQISDALVSAFDKVESAEKDKWYDFATSIGHKIINAMGDHGAITPFLKGMANAALDEQNANDHAKNAADLAENQKTMAVMRQQDAENLKDKIKQSVGKFDKDMSPLRDLIDKYLKKAAGLGGGKSKDFSDDPPYKMQFTSLEKMGFVMNGIGNPMHAEFLKDMKRTADGVWKLVGIKAGGYMDASSVKDVRDFMSVNQPL